MTALIPTYNCAPFLPEAIESALAQDYAPIEIVVADDGSTDRTPQVLEAFADRIRYVTIPHGGAGAARNAALRASSGSLIAFLDADDVWLPGKISAQVRIMRERPEVGVCHTGYEMFGEDEGPVVYDGDDCYEGDCFERQFRHNGLATTSVLMRRHLLPPHRFYEDMPITQDYAMWVQVLLSCQVVYIPEVLHRYRVHARQNTRGKARRWGIYEGLARLRMLDAVGGQLPAGEGQRLRAWALERLERDTYNRYWRGDYKWATLGFSLLHRYGRSVPLRRRVFAALRGMRIMGGTTTANADLAGESV